MLPRRLRLTRAALIPTGKELRATSPHFSISVRPTPSGSAVVVSKKTEKTAVGRHRLKRRIYSILAPYASGGAGIVVYARKGSPLLSFKELSQELEQALARLLGPGGVR